MQKPEIKLNTVGIVGSGKYAGWYVVVLPNPPSKFPPSYTIFVCTDTGFTFNPAERECYDWWMPNISSVEHHFEINMPQVRWDESIAPPEFDEPTGEMKHLSEKFQARMKQLKASQNGMESDN